MAKPLNSGWQFDLIPDGQIKNFVCGSFIDSSIACSEDKDVGASATYEDVCTRSAREGIRTKSSRNGIAISRTNDDGSCFWTLDGHAPRVIAGIQTQFRSIQTTRVNRDTICEGKVGVNPQGYVVVDTVDERQFLETTDFCKICVNHYC